MLFSLIYTDLDFLNIREIVVNISANSEFEAIVIFLYNKFSHSIEYSRSISYACNTKNILKYYYKLEEKYIDYEIKYHMSPVDIVCYWVDDGKYSPKQRLSKILPNMDIFKIPSFISMLRIKNKKFIKHAIHSQFFNIKICQLMSKSVLTPITKITFITINRILKKISNTQYWYILRML